MTRGSDATPRYRLVRSTRTVDLPRLDDDQQRVVDHPGGPLLVLAGPGTGKTTTLVEAVVDRVERRGADPSQVLALTFSRKAAEQLRDRVTARLGRTTATPVAATFHSFAYGLIRAYAPADLYESPLRLLSAPEQDVVLGELLTDHPESVRWPDSLRQALGTRGFAQEVHAVLSRAREKRLDPERLRTLGRDHDRPELVAAGLLLDQYLTVLDSQGAIDYADLIRRATLEAEVHRDELRARFRHVFVDEYQDTDPGQVALLRAIAGDGRDLVVVGDPHQSIYAFRGAEVGGILDFPRAFPRADGERAEVVVLSTIRRFGPRLLAATQRVAARLPLGGSIDRVAQERFLAPTAQRGVDPGRAEVHTYDTGRAEAEHLADLLRRAHLEDGLAWSDMAVLVRSGRTSIPPLQRALAAAGVPVEVAADDTPLVQQPVVRALVGALRAAVHLDVDDPADDDHVDPDRAHGLLQSPLAGLDAGEVRLLGRLLRRREQQVAQAAGRPPRASPELLREALTQGGFDGLLDAPSDGPSDGPPDGPGRRSPGAPGPGDRPRAVVGRAAALARLLSEAHRLVSEGATAEQVLWALWSGTTWPQRLQDAIARGGPGARSAHRDLDALCALFDVAARAEEQRGHTSVHAFLAALTAQQLPADTLAERGVHGDVVRLLTAHRSKGLEWPLVVVAHVQEGGWPDLRRRGSLLQADRLGADGLVPPVTTRSLLADERRLFYVACTRARRRLVVTAVASSDDDGEQASRFLEELLPPRTDRDRPHPQIHHHAGRPVRPLSLVGLVAELRRTAGDEQRPEPLRRAAAARLVRLTREHQAGSAWVPSADPASWWGTRAWTRSDEPVRPAGEPVGLSASALTGLEQCPAQWFLTSEAGGARAATQAQGFGNVVHALADRIAREEQTASGPSGSDDAILEQLMVRVDEVWSQIPFRTPWSGDREREEARQALRRFLEWHHRADARTLLATEQPIRAELALPDGQRVRLRGYADRVELDAEGRVVVVDLKTSKYAPTGEEIVVHPQLGLYQLAVEHGAVDDLLAAQGREVPGEAGGAELWQLRQQVRGRLKVQAQARQEADAAGDRIVERQLMDAATAVRGETFPARPGSHCQHCDFVGLCPAQQSGTVLS